MKAKQEDHGNASAPKKGIFPGKSERKDSPMIELGSKVRDKITGFEGIAIAKLIHITGCDRYGIQPKVNADSKIPDPEYFDETRLEVLEPSTLNVKPEVHQKPGGDPKLEKAIRF